MRQTYQIQMTVILLCLSLNLFGQSNRSYLTPAHNPIIWADVPDMSIIRVGVIYYMSSTTMHMSPGIPIMKSYDLINWKLVNYAYDTLANNDALLLQNGQQAYGQGSWASCLRYINGYYFVSTFSSTSGKTHVYFTNEIKNRKWEELSFKPPCHDHTLFFEEKGKAYIIWGSGKLYIAEIDTNFSGIKEGTKHVLIENASTPAGTDIMLPAEGSQLFKVHGKYYLFNIVWPRNGMRTVVVHRANKITGPYEGKVILQDRGIAQGGLIDTPEGKWYAYLFRDNGAVGRIPYLVPVTWENDWPVLGKNGKVPDTLDILVHRQNIEGIVASDEFNHDKPLPLVWQWNHNPDNEYWSLNERAGYLRLTNGRIDQNFLDTRNTLTQRTFGPQCSATIKIDVRHMKKGDYTGLGALQKLYGFVGVKMKARKKYLIMVNESAESPKEVESIALHQKEVYLRIDMDFRDKTDKAYFYYSINGKDWTRIGNTLQMKYTLPHFMGYRFAIFNYGTISTGGYVDIDWFRIGNNSKIN